MTMTKLNSAPPAVKVAMVEYAVTSADKPLTVTAPTVSGYTFVCWVDFRPTIGYGVWKAGSYTAVATDVWPQVPTSVTTVPSGKKIQCYALYTRTGIVLPDALADATVPESYDSAIQEAIDNANEAAEEAREAAEEAREATPPPVKLGFGYGHCTTAAATAAKTVAISGYTLNTGGIVTVLFDNDVPAGATLNVTSKGAKAIYHNGAAIADGVIKAGDTATFVYSGQYHLVSVDRDAYTLPTATASTLGGVKVGDGLSVASDGELSVTDYGNIVTQSNFGTVLDETSRFTVVAADATSAVTIGSTLGQRPNQVMPNIFNNASAIFLAINVRTNLAWMNGARMELAPLSVDVDTQTQAITLYARGRSSMAYGVAGVDTSWTITALPTDVDGVSF